MLVESTTTPNTILWVTVATTALANVRVLVTCVKTVFIAFDVPNLGVIFFFSELPFFGYAVVI
jgi:hypothetical protein